MKTALMDRTELLALALAAARASAALVHTGWRKHPPAEHKGAVELVTEFDRASEALLRERLAETGFACVGEETGGERAAGEADPTFFVDPLDGTTNFVHGHPFYCVSVGLLVGPRAVLGAVVAPALGVEWTGLAPTADEPGFAKRNGVPCEVSDVTTFDDALLATGFPYDRRNSPDNNFDAFVAIKRRAQAVRRCGSAAIDLCLVADGTYDGYWERKLGTWDIAAGAAIVLGAGGRVSAFDGGEPDLTVGHLVATNGRVHDELVRALAEVV
jgi:myo-inositol-1(or 4)-monophosphatase